MDWLEIGTIVGVCLGAFIGFAFSLVTLKLSFSHDWRKFHRANQHQTHIALAEASFALLNAIDAVIALDCKDAASLKMTADEHAAECRRQRKHVFTQLERLWDLQGRLVLDATEDVIDGYNRLRKQLAALRREGHDQPDFINRIGDTRRRLFTFMNRLRVQSGLAPLERITSAHSLAADSDTEY